MSPTLGTLTIRDRTRRAVGLLECARKSIDMARKVGDTMMTSRRDALEAQAKLHATAAAELAAAIGFIRDVIG